MIEDLHSKTLDKIIVRPSELKTVLLRTYSDKSTVVLVKGVFDLFHTGHYYSFVNAKKYGDVLVVAVNSDEAVTNRKGKERPIIGQNDRMLLIAALSCVDWVTLYQEESPYEVLKIVQPNVFAASHFESLTEIERQELKKHIHFQIVSKRGENSTTKIISKIRGESLV